MLTANWNYPTRIYFGAGRINELSHLVKSLPSQNPLVVTDSGLAKTNLIADILQQLSLDNLAAGLFSEIKPNPTEDNIQQGVKFYKANHHDSVIAIGGGSALDAGKAIALMVGQDRNLFDFEDIGDNWTRVNTKTMAPVIAVPTTAGTGSEVGRASVIVDLRRQAKCIVFHPNMLPGHVIADPTLTQSLPQHLTAATGIDAMVHSLEAYLSPGYHPMADGIAVQGIQMVKEWLPNAYKNGQDIEARSQMLAASMMGATAFQKGLGGIHALGHPIGAIFDKHHGLLNAILMPYVLKENQSVIEQKIAHLNRVLQIQSGFFNSATNAFLNWILEFREQLGIPHSLAEIGIDKSQQALIGEMASVDPSAAGNPQVLSAQQYSQLFCRAVEGNLQS